MPWSLVRRRWASRPSKAVMAQVAGLRGGKGTEEVMRRTSRGDLSAEEDEGEVYVTLQFDPLRALYDATRRVRWVLGVAWRTLSRAVSSRRSPRRRRTARNAPQPRASRSEQDGETSLASAAKVSRRRGCFVLVTAAETERSRRRLARIVRNTRQSDVIYWAADFEAACKLVLDELGQRPRGEAFLALATADEQGSLRILAVRQQVASLDADSIERWLARCMSSHAIELTALKRIAEDAALLKSQADELAQAVEDDRSASTAARLHRQQSLQRQEAARLAAEEEQKIAQRRATKAANLPREPPADAEAVVVAVRDARGIKHARRFAPNTVSTILLDWLDVLKIDLERYDLKRPGNPLPIDTTRSFLLRDELGRRVLLECIEKKQRPHHPECDPTPDS